MENRCSCKLRKGAKKVKHLIVYCHPNPKSLSAAYKEEVVRISENACADVNVRDLYCIGFHPVLSDEDMLLSEKGMIPADIKVEQDYIKWAELITFIYPVWWTGLPAMMKGYFDRVLSEGFAFEKDQEGNLKKMLNGKRVVILNNMGQSFGHYQENGMLDAMKLTTDQGIFEFCGFEVVEHRFFGHMNRSTKAEREGHINQLKFIYTRLFQG